MLIGNGCDLIEIKRIEKALSNSAFAKRIFTAIEQEYCESRGAQKYASYAARFAAKEALLKALGTGLRGGSLLEIEVRNNQMGKPEIFLTGHFAALAQSKKITCMHLSLTHTKSMAMAQVILEG